MELEKIMRIRIMTGFVTELEDALRTLTGMEYVIMLPDRDCGRAKDSGAGAEGRKQQVKIRCGVNRKSTG